MPFIYILSLLFVFQLVAYLLLDKYGYKKWKIAAFLVVLVLNFYVLPTLVIDSITPDRPTCGMPALAILMAFWLLGGLLVISTHIIYYFIKHK